MRVPGGLMVPAVRVCHVIHSLQRGGAEDLLIDLADAAPASAIDISVLSLMPADPARASRLADSGVPVASLGLRSRWDARALVKAPERIAALSPQVLHTHLKHADLVGAVAARRLGVPMVSTLHLIEHPRGPVQRSKRLLGTEARMATARRTIAVSDAQRHWYLNTFGAPAERVVTVHNGVADPPQYPQEQRDAARAELGVGKHGILAVMVALMRPGKGHDVMIDAAADLPNNVTVALVGDGGRRPELGRRARAAGSRVIFTGYRSDVPLLLSASDLLVHPTFADALPTALIHGLAAGLPIVASNVGGIPEIVTPDVGVLIPAGDARALTKTLAGLAGDGAARHRLGAAARRRFTQHFSASQWSRRLRTLYHEVIRESV